MNINAGLQELCSHIYDPNSSSIDLLWLHVDSEDGNTIHGFDAFVENPRTNNTYLGTWTSLLYGLLLSIRSNCALLQKNLGEYH